MCSQVFVITKTNTKNKYDKIKVTVQYPHSYESKCIPNHLR